MTNTMSKISTVAEDIKQLFMNSDEESDEEQEHTNVSPETFTGKSDEGQEKKQTNVSLQEFIEKENKEESNEEQGEINEDDYELNEKLDYILEYEPEITNEKNITIENKNTSVELELEPLVSVIIPTYNRFNYLMNTIDSVKYQTYTNLEIIVVNDGSTQDEYYGYDWEGNGIIIIHMKENSKKKFGYPCVGHVINQGLEIFTGDYFTTCDDDDIWFPHKIQTQLDAVKKTGLKMCATEGLTGEGIYDKNNKYLKYNSEKHFKLLQKIYKKKGKNELKNKIPNIWNHRFIHIHNCIVACSVMIHRDIIKKIGKKLEIKMSGQLINGKMEYTNYNYWLRALEHTNCIYVDEVCFYYDNGHGDGKNY